MDSKYVINEIENTFSRLTAALSKFSKDQLNRIPFEGSWTAGQVTEHIIKSIGGIPDQKTTASNRPHNEKIEAIREMFLNFQLKFKTAPFLEPQQNVHDLQVLLTDLDSLKEAHLEAARTKDLTALCLDMELPTFGFLTRYEWLRFMMVHTQRHTQQIENIYVILCRQAVNI
jgi:hypothetical protein